MLLKYAKPRLCRAFSPMDKPERQRSWNVLCRSLGTRLFLPNVQGNFDSSKAWLSCANFIRRYTHDGKVPKSPLTQGVCTMVIGWACKTKKRNRKKSEKNVWWDISVGEGEFKLITSAVIFINSCSGREWNFTLWWFSLVKRFFVPSLFTIRHFFISLPYLWLHSSNPKCCAMQ